MSLALEKGFGNVLYFQEKYPGVEIKQYQNTSAALDAVARGEADAYAGNRAVATYLMEKEVMINLRVHGRMKKPGSILAIGTRKDWPVLRNILQKAMDTILDKEKQSILRKWVEIETRQLVKTLHLTAEERAWLAEHKQVRLGVDSAWPPVEWVDENGKYHGMTSEYFDLIDDMLAIESTPARGLSWVETLKRAEQGQIDIIPAIVPTEGRRKYLNFTSPYLTFPFVIFTRNDASLVTELRDLYGKRVAVEEGQVSHDYLKRDHPRINLITYQNTAEILQSLSLGQIDAYVGNLTVAGYLINKTGLINLKVAAPTPYRFDLSIGVRKDWPELIPILEKALLMIDEEQRNAIRLKWLKLQYDLGVDYTLVRRAVVIAVIIVLLIFGWMLFIQRQKRALNVAKAETEAVNIELQKANEKLRELARLKSMFIASISHELRTPLNAIIGFSGMMMHGAFGELSDKYKDYITRVNRSGQHLLSLITDIIDISKIETGRIDFTPSDFKLNEMVDEAVDSVRQQVQNKGMSLQTDIPEGISLFTDRRRLLQCLLNFLSNSIKFTEKGSISVTAKNDPESVLLSVHDTGIGISETDRTRLFEAFEQIESHLRVKAGGTGLVLYLTKKIVTEMLHGEVGMESTLDQGSTFWFRVPKTVAAQQVKINA